MIREQFPDRLDAAVSRSSLAGKDLLGSRAHSRGSRPVAQQVDEHLRELIFLSNANGIVCDQIFGNSAEVGIVRTHHNGNAKLRRLQRIVTAGRNQATADESDRRQ